MAVYLGALRKSVVPRRRRGRQDEDQLAASLELQRSKLRAAYPDVDWIWAEDARVSGAVSPFNRPDLGPKLAALDRDVLAVARFDRVSWSVRGFSDLCDWLRDHGKIQKCRKQRRSQCSGLKSLAGPAPHHDCTGLS